MTSLQQVDPFHSLNHSEKMKNNDTTIMKMTLHNLEKYMKTQEWKRCHMNRRMKKQCIKTISIREVDTLQSHDDNKKMKNNGTAIMISALHELENHT